MLQFVSVPYQSNNTKLSNGFEVMLSDTDSVTTGHVRIKGHLRGLSKKFVEFVNKSKSTSAVAFKLSHV